ncbi:MAG TPA: PLDc N-terminal domain-containing protein [Acidimicrobiales bacterium]|nr:PLDc N-terminal domain-containing protein [Acidimicrobiales bacterium]
MNLAAIVPIVVVALGFATYCIVDVIRAPSVKHLPKWGWIVACLVSIPLGGIVYLTIGREDR